jgi:quercetin 2,3-dioxygenase
MWVNLAARDKRTAPSATIVPSARLPVVHLSKGAVAVRVLAGEALGVQSPLHTRTPSILLHCSMQPGSTLQIPLPAEWTAFAYVISGRARFGSDERRADEGQTAVFARAGGAAHVVADAAPLELLLAAGQPLGEPVVRYGGIVMNSDVELRQALEEYGRGRMARATRRAP